MRDEQMRIEDIIFALKEHEKGRKNLVQKYVCLVSDVTAIQWKGNNLLEVSQFLGDDSRVKASWDMLAINGDFIVPKNHYIIRHSDGGMLVCGEETFNKRYIPYVEV